ncbi:hypothetical protein H4R99_001976 [Coemansia sp. RSA 1722]|nr:hypothetical protein LPJ57_000634 [Coemansia sp. RSA 486]KAJ2237521.1 hypothetical protein IWW45_000905 [Coemansia sp. RSA 485]KAJ2604176.1 hypothetical protein H4R99_001976 [Coemansia sp. RSA 1722]KAJ2638190.1 hypothetical protein GGF40_001830 [Coemansia sp. RSA 1286]
MGMPARFQQSSESSEGTREPTPVSEAESTSDNDNNNSESSTEENEEEAEAASQNEDDSDNGDDDEKVEEVPPVVDSADEGDEEFVQTESESELERNEALLDHMQTPPSSDAEGSIVTRRRDQKRQLRRLRHELRSSAGSGSDDSISASVQSRLKRSLRHTRATSALDSAADQRGYASSPTRSPMSRRLRRGHADNVHPPSSLRKQQLFETPPPADAANATDSDRGVAQSGTETPTANGRRPGRRKIAPALISTTAMEETRSHGTVSAGASPPPFALATSPPPVIDKPREERSYREFFPDLNVHAPLVVQLRRETPPSTASAPAESCLAQSGSGLPDVVELGTRIAQAAGRPSSAPRSPLGSNSQPVSAGGSDLVPMSRTSSGLSIRLFFNDPQAPRSHAPPPPLRPAGMGKSAESYASAGQSSVVVLAPKKPVLSLPETRFKQVIDTGSGRGGYRRPEAHYVRNAELTEKDLAGQVEYDLDDVDREWLRRLNAARTGGVELSAAALENALDALEKEWFDVAKDVQKSISALQQERLPAEESACAICGEEECDNTNAIVFCDGCNLAVHQDCYGVPYIPEGQWLCRRCMLSPDKDVSCVLCPQSGGAFKKTTTNKWAHLLCALWIPEVGISNTVYMEPIDSIDQIPRSRWRLYCHLCHRKTGACIQCSHRQCVVAFHATCARRARLSMTVRPDKRSGEPVFRAFCERHTPIGHPLTVDVAAPLRSLAPRRARSEAASLSLLSMDLASMLPSGSGNRTRQWPPGALSLVGSASAETAALFDQAVAADESSNDASLQLTMRVFNPDRPVINEYVFSQVVDKLPGRLSMQQRSQLGLLVARFWALKRSMRHGAPLLKRLHLEPWTASATQQRALEMAEEQRQAFVRRLRTDLERVRLLVESVRRREREKLKSARAMIDYVQMIVDPLTPVLKPIVDELVDKRDPRGVLSHPVTAEEAPDYFEVITEPMDLGTVRQKVESYQYRSLAEFEHDLGLVVDNCMKYNKPTTYYYQHATRIKRHIDRLVASARTALCHLPIDPATGQLMLAYDPDIFSYNLQPPVSSLALASEEERASDSVEGRGNSPENVVDAKEMPAENVQETADPKSPIAEMLKKQPETPSRVTRSRAKGPVAESAENLELKTPTSESTTAIDPQSASEPAKSPEEPAQKLESEPGSEPKPEQVPMPATPDTRANMRARARATGTDTPLSAPANSKRTRSQQKPKRAAAPSRRMTLFEQLSVPPPDVRSSLRRKYAIFHPDLKPEDVPGNEIPDDINVLKSRLRRTSSLVTPLPETPKKRKPTDESEDTPGAVLSSTKKPRLSTNLKQTMSPIKMYNGALPTAAILGEDPSKYPLGTVVWAKMASYPWFPAEICAGNDRRAPEQVILDKRDDCNVLVFFFNVNPANRTWKWVSAQQICKLGVDKQLDMTFYKAKKAKSKSMARSMRLAYVEACKSKGVEPLVP